MNNLTNGSVNTPAPRTKLQHCVSSRMTIGRLSRKQQLALQILEWRERKRGNQGQTGLGDAQGLAGAKSGGFIVPLEPIDGGVIRLVL